MKALLIVDNARSHLPTDTEDGKIWKIYMPPNVTHLIQPIDRMPFAYSKIVASEANDIIKVLKSLSLYDASCMIGFAWNNVKVDALSKCWTKFYSWKILSLIMRTKSPFLNFFKEMKYSV